MAPFKNKAWSWMVTTIARVRIVAATDRRHAVRVAEGRRAADGRRHGRRMCILQIIRPMCT